MGLYRLCGSAAVKKELRDAFERDSAAVTLNEELFPDINVVTGECMYTQEHQGLSSCALPQHQNQTNPSSIIPAVVLGVLLFLLHLHFQTFTF